MKKILFIHYNINNFGGIVNVLSNLSSTLSKEFEVTILSLSPEIEKPYYPIHPNVKIITVDTPSHPVIKFSDFLRKSLSFIPKIYNITDYLGHLGIYLKLKPWLLKNHQEYDTIISCWYKISCMMSGINTINSKLVVWEHTDYSSSSPFWKYLRFKNYKKSKAICCLVNQSLDYYKTINLKSYIIPNLVNFNIEKIKTVQKKKEVLSISSLDNNKNVKDLIIAFHKSSLYKNNWTLKIIGDGYLEGDLKRQVQNLRIVSNVTFTGRLNTAEIIEHLKTASIFGMTSKREGLPIVLIEAQFAGLALIAYDCPTGPSEIITKENGFLIPLHNVNSFSEKLKILGHNSSLLKEKQQGSLKAAQRYSTENIVNLWKEVLR